MNSDANFENTIDRSLFNELVKHGSIKGQDLLSLSNVNSTINKWCDQNFFKRRLEDEYERTIVTFDPCINYVEIYMNMHLTEWYVIDAADEKEKQYKESSIATDQRLSTIFEEKIVKKEGMQKYKVALATVIESKVSNLTGVSMIIRSDRDIADSIGLTYLGEITSKGLKSKPVLEFENPKQFGLRSNSQGVGCIYILTKDDNLYFHEYECVDRFRERIEKGIEWIVGPSNVAYFIPSKNLKNSIIMNYENQFISMDGEKFTQNDFDIIPEHEYIKYIHKHKHRHGDVYYILSVNKNRELRIISISMSDSCVKITKVSGNYQVKYFVNIYVTVSINVEYFNIQFINTRNKYVKLGGVIVEDYIKIHNSRFFDSGSADAYNAASRYPCSSFNLINPREVFNFEPGKESPTVIVNNRKKSLPFNNVSIMSTTKESSLMRGILDVD